MKLSVATSRINCSGPNRLDITVKSGQGAGRVLAPTWAMVMALKSGAVSWEQYAQDYMALMRQRYRDGYPGFTGNPFEQFLKMGRVVLCCYCKAGDPCHRHLAAGILQKLAIDRGITITLEGEI